MTWAGKRQLIILSIFVIVIAAVLFLVLRPVVAPAPTCSDNRQNGSETGIDCGGSCSKACTFEVSKVNVVWARSFKVADGVYSAVAYLTNPNASFEARNVGYTMKLYDAKNLLVAERRGKIDIPAKASFPVFEGGININKAEAKSAFFILDDITLWQKTSIAAPKIVLGSPVIESEGLPVVRTTISNDTAAPLKNLPVVAVVYDVSGNAMASSETIVDVLAKGASQQLVYTWMIPFSSEVGRVEFYPLYRF